MTCKPAYCAGDVDYSLWVNGEIFPIFMSSVNLSFKAYCDQLKEGAKHVVLSISVQPQDQHRVAVGNPSTTEVIILGKGRQSVYRNYMLS